MKIKILLSIISLGLLYSCSYKYQYFYKTYLETPNNKLLYQDSLKSINNSDTTMYSTLIYQDSIMKFTFNPQPNGIFFVIQNLTNENIFLLWDGSYFIDPTNNSSKALNTDILNTENKIVEKENYESIIPKKGTFRRFTTSAKNVTTFEKLDFTKYYITPNFTFQNVFYDEIFLHNPYWVTTATIKYDDKNDAIIQHKAEMDRMKSYLQNNNNLGLGFTFRKGEKKIDYDFKIKINKVFVLRSTDDENYKCVDTLIVK